MIQATEALDAVTQAADSARAAPDSTSAIAEIGEGVGQVGQLLLDGEWSLAFDRIWSNAVEGAVGLAPRLLQALFVGLVFYLLYRLVFRVTSRVLRTRPDQSSSGLRDLVLNTIRVVGLGLIALLVLSQLGLDITAAIAGLGILGLGLSFAAKDSLENFIAGITILLDRPFSVGDVVEVNGVYGTVVRFTLRSTRIRTLQHRILVMPNIGMIDQSLLNHSASGYVRIDIPFGIAYKEHIDGARDAILSAIEARADDRLSEEHPPEVVARALADSSVNLDLRLFAKDARDEIPVRVDHVELIRETLRDAEIEIPFPHLQLFVDGAKGLEGLLRGAPTDGDGRGSARTTAAGGGPDSDDTRTAEGAGSHEERGDSS